MVVENKRKKGETFEAFVRRFNKRLMQSGVILDFKKKAYKKKSLNKNLQKSQTLSRKVYREKKEYLKKIGRLVEEPRGGRRRR